MLDPAEQNILDHIDSVGWSVMTVSPAAGSDDPEEWFAYTIGLSKTFGWPEIICFGLATDAMVTMLNNAVQEARERRLTPAPGLELRQVLDGYSVRLVENDCIPDNYLGFAAWYARYSGMPMPARLQLVWPDQNDHFPDELECDPEVRRLQTPCEVE